LIVPDDKLPEDEMWDAVILKKAKPPNLSTVVVRNSSAFSIQPLLCYLVAMKWM